MMKIYNKQTHPQNRLPQESRGYIEVSQRQRKREKQLPPKIH